MYYGQIKKTDIANGPGVRVSLFVSGCTRHCKNCFNPETWSFTYGKPFTPQTEEELLQALAPAYINGLSLLGGEPFEPANQWELLLFLRRVRKAYPEKDIWCYTGCTLDTDLARAVRTIPKSLKKCSGRSTFWWMAPLWRRSRILPCASAVHRTSG